MSAMSPAGESYWDVACDADGCTATERRDSPWPPNGSAWRSTPFADWCPAHKSGDL